MSLMTATSADAWLWPSSFEERTQVITMPKQLHAFGWMFPTAVPVATTSPGKFRYIVQARYTIGYDSTSLDKVLADFWYEVHEDFSVTATRGYVPVVELGKVEGFLLPPFYDPAFDVRLGG